MLELQSKLLNRHAYFREIVVKRQNAKNNDPTFSCYRLKIALRSLQISKIRKQICTTIRLSFLETHSIRTKENADVACGSKVYETITKRFVSASN